MRYQNDKIKSLVRGKRCYLDIPGICNGQNVVPCHSPDYERMHGKGMSLKAHDIFIVPGCQMCHDAIDMRIWIEEADNTTDLQWFFNRAHANFLLDIIRSGELKDAL